MMRLIKYYFCAILIMSSSPVVGQSSSIVHEEIGEIRINLSRSLSNLREKSLPFCRPFATLDVIPFATNEITAPLRLWLNWPEGIAEAANISANDSLVAVNDQLVVGKSDRDFQEKIWKVAREKSAETGKPIKLKLRSSAEGTDQEREVFIRAKWVCGRFNPLIKENIIAETKVKLKQLSELSVHDLLIMQQTREVAFEALDGQSTGKGLTVMGTFLTGTLLDLGTAVKSSADLESPLSTNRPYTDNDYLKADALAMMLLRISDQSINNYIRWTVSEGMAEKKVLLGMLKQRREYDESAQRKLNEVQGAILAGDPLRAAAIVNLKLNSAQEKILKKIYTPSVSIKLTDGINQDFRNAYSPTNFATLEDISAVPVVTNACRERYEQWLKKSNPKGFAISEKGGCGFSSTTKPPKSGLPTDPAERALQVCSKENTHTCRLYAIDDSVVWTGQ